MWTTVKTPTLLVTAKQFTIVKMSLIAQTAKVA